MSGKERRRMGVLDAVERGETTLKEAALRMGVSVRQAIRLKARYRAGGAEAIVHRSRGRPGNRRADSAFRDRVIRVYREQYDDFGPTLAAEKMAERDGIEVHRETLRRWLTDSCDWLGKKRHPLKHRRRRLRRERLGELVQLDGSDHDWFEGRGPRACLMVMTDDATGRKLVHMAESETTGAALALLRKWVERWGTPQALYVDRNSAYWSPTALHEPEKRGLREAHGDFGRVAHGLGVELIPAYSPQAKGRVERANGVLQDRLIKEMRLEGIATIAEANAMIDAFIDGLNARQEVPPRCDHNAHRVFAPRDAEDRERLFSIDVKRTVARDHTVSYQGRTWQIPDQPGGPPPKAAITLLRGMDGVVRGRWRGQPLAIEPLDPRLHGLRRRQGPDLVTTPD